MTPFSEKNKSLALPALKFPLNQLFLISRTSPAFRIFSKTTFLPLSFMGGKTGRLFIEFGVVLSFAVIISSFVALTLTPMMCSKILEKNQKHQQRELFSKFKRFYESSLLASQNNTKIVYSVTIIFIIISFLLFKFIPK